MDTPRGVLILDIDGTINPFYARHTLEERPDLLPGFEEHGIPDPAHRDARVFLQTDVLKSTLEELKELGIDLVWGSAWNEGSNFILRALFPESAESWPTVIFPQEVDFSSPIQSWKLVSVRDFVETHYDPSVPLIWLDDEIFDDAQQWLDGREGRGLLIRPERHRGLTEIHWNQVIDFARSL